MQEMIGGNWLAWKELPETQEFVKGLQDSIDGNKEFWAQGAYMSASAHETLANNMVSMGETRALMRILSAISEIRMTKDSTNDE